MESKEKQQIIENINKLLLRGGREAAVEDENALDVKEYFETKGWVVSLHEGYLSFEDPKGRTLLRG